MKLAYVSGKAGAVWFGILAGTAMLAQSIAARAQTLEDDTLGVTTVVSGLEQPIAMAFIGPNDILVTEKATGRVKRVTNGIVTGVVLDLAVNSASERGLLGIALHPEFPQVPFVYLYNTESTTAPIRTCSRNVPLLGNRVDRFVWNGSTLTFNSNIITPARVPERPEQRGRSDAARAARQPQRRGVDLRPRREALHHHRRQRPARLQPERAGRPGPGRRLRRTRARRRSPHRRHPAPQRRRQRAERQPVLRDGRAARRRSRRPERRQQRGQHARRRGPRQSSEASSPTASATASA